MEVLASTYKISDIQPFHDKLIDMNGLWIIHADKIPPHIGISVDGYFYSLKAKGKDSRVAVEKLLYILDDKKISCVFVLLKKRALVKEVKSVFDGFEQTIPGEITCLQPIKEVLDIVHAEKLVDLLSVLKDKSCIAGNFGLNLPENFTGILDYSISDIHRRLNKLSTNAK